MEAPPIAFLRGKRSRQIVDADKGADAFSSVCSEVTICIIASKGPADDNCVLQLQRIHERTQIPAVLHVVVAFKKSCSTGPDFWGRRRSHDISSRSTRFDTVRKIHWCQSNRLRISGACRCRPRRSKAQDPHLAARTGLQTLLSSRTSTTVTRARLPGCSSYWFCPLSAATR